MGVVVRETARETPMATLRVAENSGKSRPTIPPMRRIGRKTATSDTDIERTVKPTSREPLRAAWNGDSPISRWRAMFSMTTIASSTTKPVAMVRAISEKLSRLKPSRYITPKEPTRERGTAMLGITVTQRFRRNRKITRTTREMVRTRVSWTSCTEARMVWVGSAAILIRIEGGTEAWSSGIRALTWSETSMTLAPGWRKTRMITAGRFSERAAPLTSSTESETSPRFPQRTRAAVPYATMRRPYWSALRDLAVARAKQCP